VDRPRNEYGRHQRTDTLECATIATESDFRIERFDIVIRPAVENILVVDLKGGRAGGSVTIAIHREIELFVAPARTYSLTGGQDVFEETFAIADPASAFVLLVQNGDAAGTRRVKSGTVAINGMDVITEAELTSTTSMIRRRVFVTSATTMRVTARGGGGETLTVALKRLTDANACGTTVTFTIPAAGETVKAATLFVSGDATGPRDSAVAVNNWRAELDLAHAGTVADPFAWFAEVPAAAGRVTLVATLTTAAGPGAQAERSVTFSPATEAVELAVSPRSGVPPLAVTLNVARPAAAAIIRYEIDYDNDGVPELTTDELPLELTHTYTTPGQYTVTVRCIRPDGSVLVGTSRVLVHSWPAIDAVLRATWTRFTEALARQDVTGAIREFDGSAREKYEGALRAAAAALPDYVASLRGLHAVSVRGDVAHYLLRRLQNGRTVGYHVYFSRDSNGVWRLVQF
jgi:hypothetical protein